MGDEGHPKLHTELLDKRMHYSRYAIGSSELFANATIALRVHFVILGALVGTRLVVQFKS